MISKTENRVILSRRNFLTYSGIAIGGISISSFLPKAFGSEIISKTTNVLPAVDTIATPSLENPVRLNFNENALGMSPNAQKAAISAVNKANRYAKAEIPLLSQSLAKHHNLSPEYILLTAGSSEGIRSSIAAWSGENTQFVIPELTYGDGEQFANIFNLPITKIPSLKDWAFDIDAFKAAVDQYPGRSIVYLVNPNNPTSTIAPTAQIIEWIPSKPKDTIFIVDEAYAEFVNDPNFQSVDTLIEQGYDNIVLLKTFSKIHAMAGLRVGYVLASPNNIKNISQFVAGEKLNYCGVCAALASMEDADFLAYSKQTTDTSRQIMEQVLDELGFYYLPSQTNFIFHQIGTDLAQYQQLLQDKHIFVGRAFPPADRWSRISLGTPGEMLYTANVLRQLRSQNLI
ncbi:aminotransferase class I/II-fold pyridoxal phosphate-dependent enzyme [Orbus wheelerorum]|uniref:pyridoxal phosphate-dependent aminotransferase n=1 Tax=Orbus wheelerorum TaxID=3074111 RepID=UPI00370D1DF6